MSIRVIVEIQHGASVTRVERSSGPDHHLRFEDRSSLALGADILDAVAREVHAMARATQKPEVAAS